MKKILDVCCGSRMFWFNKKPLGSCGGVAAKHRSSILASHPEAEDLILSVPQKNFNVAKIYQGHWLEESGYLLDNVNQTHFVLAS